MIFTISQGVLGNLGVNLIHPPKLCAGLLATKSRTNRRGLRGEEPERHAAEARVRAGRARRGDPRGAGEGVGPRPSFKTLLTLYIVSFKTLLTLYSVI